MTMNHDEQKIAEIRKALDAATPGPWKWIDPGGYDRKKLVGEHEIMNFGASMSYLEFAGQEPDDADAHLIANAPEWLRFLLDELDRKDEENRKLREELDAVAEGYRQQVKLAGELMDKLVSAQVVDE